MTQVLYAASDTATLRADIEKPSLSNKDAVANAPVTSGGHYKVPRQLNGNHPRTRIASNRFARAWSRSEFSAEELTREALEYAQAEKSQDQRLF